MREVPFFRVRVARQAGKRVLPKGLPQGALPCKRRFFSLSQRASEEKSEKAAFAAFPRAIACSLARRPEGIFLTTFSSF